MNLLAVEPETADLLPWGPEVAGGAVLSMAAQADTTGATGGAVYVGGAFNVLGAQQGSVAAFDAESGELLERNPAGGATFAVLYSERHGAVFLAGDFENVLRGSGHAYVAAVTPAVGLPPTAGEPTTPPEPSGALSAAYPNPFGGQASLTLAVPSSQRVEVALYDVLGRRVAVLHDGPLAAGSHVLTLDGAGLPSGVYVVRASGETFGASRRVTVVR